MLKLAYAKFIKDESGQTMAEFAIVLPILVALLVWTIQFYDMFALKHKTQEAGRYAAWETAYGRSAGAVRTNAQNIVSNSQTIIGSPAGVNVSANNTSSIVGNSIYFSTVGGLRLRFQMGLDRDTFVRTNARASYTLRYSAGMGTTNISSNSGLIYNSWDLQTRTGGSSGDDMEDVVAGIFWGTSGIGSFMQKIDDFQDALNSGTVGTILSFIAGIRIDINPMGHIDLTNVPSPSN
ncbi:pilus assembly protein [candidate division KSB1 bacterium]|nr:pilus assembly protein [candidate division KSB1 bacterium]